MHDYSAPPLLVVQRHSGEAVIDLRQVAAVEAVSHTWPVGEGTAERYCTVVHLRSGQAIGFSSPGYAEVKAAWKRAMS